MCKAKYMAPLYNPAVEKAEDARACIDQFEFPDIPCDVPRRLGAGAGSRRDMHRHG